jgi:hypothetical protein
MLDEKPDRPTSSPNKKLVVQLGALANVAGAIVIAIVAAVFFLAVVIGGGVYRTDCISDSGQMTRTWGAEGAIPYTWSPNDGHCQAHSLGRYVAGRLGILGDVDK